MSENETPENDTSDSQSLLEGGVLEGHDMNSENDTSEAQGGASAVLVSITQTDSNKYKYEFKWHPPFHNQLTPIRLSRVIVS